MSRIKIVKIRNFLAIVFCLILFTGCTEKEYVYLDVAPQLEIIVEDQSANIIEGATVKLYNSSEDFYENNNPLQTKVTNQSGKALFKDLDETVYYFYIEKGEMNNYYEVVTFARPLRKNEIKTLVSIIR